MSAQNDLISDLHLKKRSAIEALDFETAEQLSIEITNQIAKHANELFADIKEEAILQLERLQASHREILEELAEEKRKLDSRLYSKFQVLFEETQDDHIHQLMDLEKERGLTLLEESEREIPEQIAILEEAKQRASLGYFQEAIEMRQKAREVGEAELESRRVQVEEHFKLAKEEMLIQHQEELDQIGELHQQELDRMKEETEEAERVAKYEFKEQVTTIRHRAQVKCEAVQAQASVKQDVISDLKATMDAMMADFESQPPVEAKLTKSEQMRLTTLSPTKTAGTHVISEITEGMLEREAQTSQPKATRTGLRPPSKSNTRLISRAHTASVRKR